MKIIFLIAAMMLVGTNALAAGSKKIFGTTATILGEWNLGSRSCTSNTPLNDGIVIGPDKISVKFHADGSYELKRTIAGCETNVKGTYSIGGMKVTFTAATSQSCRDPSPQPMPETYSMYAACLNDTELALVATGTKAVACPAPDALIFNYEKVQPGSR